jgi:hypothetical protein
MPTLENMSKILEHVEQKLQSYFKLLVPSVIRLRSLLYGRQVSSSKTIIQEVKVNKETKANKIVLHPVKVKKKIVDIEIDPTLMKPYSHI